MRPVGSPASVGAVLQQSDFHDLGAEGFLLRLPGGSRLFCASDGGVNVYPAGDATAEDLMPFVHSSLFAAAAWFAGWIPLCVSAVLRGDKLLLIGARRDRLREELTARLVLHHDFGFAGTMVALDPQDFRICANGEPLAMSRELADELGLAGPPVRTGLTRCYSTLPVADKTGPYDCQALLSLSGGEAEVGLVPVPPVSALTTITGHVFLPQVGKHLLGAERYYRTRVVLSRRLSMFRAQLAESDALGPDAANWIAGRPEFRVSSCAVA